jgi:hypothetical protein
MFNSEMFNSPDLQRKTNKSRHSGHQSSPRKINRRKYQTTMSRTSRNSIFKTRRWTKLPKNGDKSFKIAGNKSFKIAGNKNIFDFHFNSGLNPLQFTK